MTLCPASVEELADALGDAASKRASITLFGRNTKRLMAGPQAPADVTISTTRLNRILEYEPRDLTVSVEAGASYADFQRTLAANGQMVPLDPPFESDCTIGGVVAANISGPRRRLYGSARDMVIGMKFVTLEGKVVQTGGMVVKNVAGLDMAKIMIGSFGTLAAIAVINFKVQPIPPASRTFIQEFANVDDAIAARDRIHKGVLQPAALDVVKDGGRYRVLVQAGGNAAVLERYARELSAFQAAEGEDERIAWADVREFTPTFLSANPEGAVVRIPATLSEVGPVLKSLPGPAIARAGTGVCYGYFDHWRDALGRGVVEYAPDEARSQAGVQLWPSPGADFEMMKKMKELFDPAHLLNRGRMYGRF